MFRIPFLNVKAFLISYIRENFTKSNIISFFLGKPLQKKIVAKFTCTCLSEKERPRLIAYTA